jgi:hypothetical protein
MHYTFLYRRCLGDFSALSSSTDQLMPEMNWTSSREKSILYSILMITEDTELNITIQPFSVIDIRIIWMIYRRWPDI